MLAKDSVNDRWKQRVANEEKDARVVFLEPVDECFSVELYCPEKQRTPEPDDYAIAAAAVATQGALTGKEIGFLTPKGSYRVKPTTSNIPGTVGSIFSQGGLEAQIHKRNEASMNSLVEQLRSPLGVIPLVGAGLSAAITFTDPPDRFPQWSELLLTMAAGTSIESDTLRLVSSGAYEAAAKLVDEHRPGDLPQKIKDAFDRKVDSVQLEYGALSYLPSIASGPVITTNFDRVLEQVFDIAGKPFTELIFGPKPDTVIQAIHQNQRALLKIHGDCRDRMFRVFTVEEYEMAYGVTDAAASNDPKQRAPSIGSLAWLMFTNRPLLCLGCSLEQDRTTAVLRALRERLPGLTHYAILAAHYSLPRWEARDKELDQMGIRPLWYTPGEYSKIEALLREMLERSSTRTIKRPVVRPATAHQPPPDAVSQHFLEVGKLIGKEPSPDVPLQTLELITRSLLDGKLAFFLGAYANLGNLPLGNEFYADLARKFERPALRDDRTAVAAFIASQYGPEKLWKEVKGVISDVPRGPSAVHRMLAALPAFLRANDRPEAAPLWVFSTNYDTLMEQAMTLVGEPFQLLYYIGGTATKDDGLFAQRTADGGTRIIERPENLRDLDPASNVIVKFNGGLVYEGGFPESVVTAAGHFERLAARIPNALPVFLRAALSDKSLLFLGHGLVEPDANALIRYSAPRDGTIKSWAIQLPPGDPESLRFWQERVDDLRRWGLEVVRLDLEEFMAALHKRWSKLAKTP